MNKDRHETFRVKNNDYVRPQTMKGQQRHQYKVIVIKMAAVSQNKKRIKRTQRSGHQSQGVKQRDRGTGFDEPYHYH